MIKTIIRNIMEDMMDILKIFMKIQQIKILLKNETNVIYHH